MPGTFAYTPAVGTLLKAGANQSLSATFTPSDTSMYGGSYKVSTSITVNPAPLTVTCDSKTMVYGNQVPALSYHISGFVNGDTASAASGAGSCSTTATSTSHVEPIPSSRRTGLCRLPTTPSGRR